MPSYSLHGGEQRRALRSRVFAHRNDYGFDVEDGLLTVHPRCSVSCVVPYYEVGAVAIDCVTMLAVSLARYQAAVKGAPPRCQIVVVDDGSTQDPFVAPEVPGIELHVVRLSRNKGRAAARNVGLQASAGFDATLFVDADVYLQPDQVEQCAGLFIRAGSRAIVPSLFVNAGSGPRLSAALAAATRMHDWRWSCVYQPSWVGCASDSTYVGRKFMLIADTDYFRSWSGMVGPWSLSNMVLGGCFMVPTSDAQAVGGFDERFQAYGFTETTLVARLIAHGCFVVPQVRCIALHVSDQPQHQSQAQRDQLLQEAHARFYLMFMAEVT